MVMSEVSYGLFECWKIFHVFFLLSAGFFFQNYIFKIELPPVTNRLEPDQARHFVGSDLGPNCLQILSADDTSRYRANMALMRY